MSGSVNDFSNSRAALAERARRLRLDKRLTLQDVADRSGLAISTISKIERGMMAPTLERTSQLARGLGVDLVELVSVPGGEFARGTFAVARRTEGAAEGETAHAWEPLFPGLQGSMVPMLGRLAPRTAGMDQMIRSPGQEFVTVLDGRLRVRAEGCDEVILDPGDSLYFDSDRGHQYGAAGDAPVRVLVVRTAAEPLKDPERDR